MSRIEPGIVVGAKKQFTSAFLKRGGGVRACIYSVSLSDSLQLIQSIRQFHFARSIQCVHLLRVGDLHLAAPPGVDLAMSGYGDNQGWGDDVGHGYHKSSLRKDEVSTVLLFYLLHDECYASWSNKCTAI